MQRTASKFLQEWLASTARKPLVMRGARQVGKTWLVRELAKQNDLELIELNFEKNPSYKSLFASNEVGEIMTAIAARQNKQVDIKKSILFLDEIQIVPELLAKLRWFAEDLPELAVIATGSLLDFVFEAHDFSMPVGRINYFHLDPLSFEEFLMANHNEQLVKYLDSYQITQEIPDALHEQLLLLLRNYFLVGGLPAAVNAWVSSNSLITVNQVQQDLIHSYRDDFTKYPRRINRERLEEVLISIPRQLNGKFVYSHVNKDVPGNEIKNALHLLNTARICHIVFSNTGAGIPLGAGKKVTPFKVILLDVGLCNTLMHLNMQSVQPQSFLLMNEGGIAEQFVGQMLRTLIPYYMDPELYYWVREDNNVGAEVDYIIQHGAKLIPIEVKAGRTGTLKSLHLLMGLRGWPIAVRFNTDKPSLVAVNMETTTKQKVQYQLLSLPLYLIAQLPRLLNEIMGSDAS